jgi:hypothetical protein
MAHCNRTDDSFHDLPGLATVSSSQKLTHPGIADAARNNLGCYTGEERAVCAYESPDHPAVVAYDYADGSVDWTSHVDDLPATGRRRWVSGLLLARLRQRSGPSRRYVFAANPAEFVAYTSEGELVWNHAAEAIAGDGEDGLGAPRCLRFDDAGHIVTATTGGWVVKLDPRDGRVADAHLLRTRSVVEGRLRDGVLITSKSSVVPSDVLYLTVRFRDDRATARPPPLGPVFLVRVCLGSPDGAGSPGRIRPLEEPSGVRDEVPDRVLVGVDRFGGSPCAWRAPDGRLLVFANAGFRSGSGVRPAITCVEDDRVSLQVRWRCVLATAAQDAIHAAPALHAPTRTLVASTRRSLFVLREFDTLTGSVPSPTPISAMALLPADIRCRAFAARLGSPCALARDPDGEDVIGYTNMLVTTVYGTYGFLGAFALPIAGKGAPRPLWCRPLAVTQRGRPAPGLGTFGQPALFRYGQDGNRRTGLIVNTVSSGTFMFK